MIPERVLGAFAQLFPGWRDVKAWRDHGDLVVQLRTDQAELARRFQLKGPAAIEGLTEHPENLPEPRAPRVSFRPARRGVRFRLGSARAPADPFKHVREAFGLPEGG